MATIKIILIAVLVLGLSTVLFSALHSSPTKPASPTVIQDTTGAVRYLPLGDSYTIGQSVPEDQRWPNQLVAKFAKDGAKISIVDNPSVTGYTTQDLIDRELGLVQKLKPDVVSIQIGVNDYVQHVPIDIFHEHLVFILDSLQKQLPKPGNIFLVTIPDYAKTPTGAQYGDPTTATSAIAEFNAIITKEAVARKLPIADVFAISQAVVSDQSLTANDGLHPSGKHYGLWVNEMYKQLKPTPLFQK